MKIVKALSSLVLASSAGLIMGLLFAPDKGSHTRKKIQQKTEDFLEDEIIGYNRIICNVKTKLDEVLNGMSIQAGGTPHGWADTNQKNEGIV